MKPGHSLEGVGSSDSVPRGSVAVGGVSHGDEGSVSVGVGEVAGLGVSAPLANSLGRPGHEGGGGSWVSSNSGVSVSVGGVSVSVGSKVAGLGISTPLSVAAIAGGLREGGGHAGPVGVGVVDGGDTVVSVARFGLGLSLVETMDGLVTGARERSSVSRGIVRSVEVGVAVGGVVVQRICFRLSQDKRGYGENSDLKRERVRMMLKMMIMMISYHALHVVTVV